MAKIKVTVLVNSLPVVVIERVHHTTQYIATLYVRYVMGFKQCIQLQKSHTVSCKQSLWPIQACAMLPCSCLIQHTFSNWCEPAQVKFYYLHRGYSDLPCILKCEQALTMWNETWNLVHFALKWGCWERAIFWIFYLSIFWKLTLNESESSYLWTTFH